MKESDYEAGRDKNSKKTRKKNLKLKYEEFEFAADAISLNDGAVDERPERAPANSPNVIANPYVTVNGKEELPCVEEVKDCNTTRTENEMLKTDDNLNRNVRIKTTTTNFDGNCNRLAFRKIYSYCTLPKRRAAGACRKSLFVTLPKRVTPDGTHIYYWCDLQKKYGNGKKRAKNLIMLATSPLQPF